LLDIMEENDDAANDALCTMTLAELRQFRSQALTLARMIEGAYRAVDAREKAGMTVEERMNRLFSR
jgi:hypothetical protein